MMKSLNQRMGSNRKEGRASYQNMNSSILRKSISEGRQSQFKTCQTHNDAWGFYTQLLQTYSTSLMDISDEQSQDLLEIRLLNVLQLIHLLLTCPTCSKKTAKETVSKHENLVKYLHFYYLKQRWAKQEYSTLFTMLNLLKRSLQTKQSYKNIKMQTESLYKRLKKARDNNKHTVPVQTSTLFNQQAWHQHLLTQFNSQLEYDYECSAIMWALYLLNQIVECQSSGKEEYAEQILSLMHHQPPENEESVSRSVSQVISGVVRDLNLCSKLGINHQSQYLKRSAMIVPTFQPKYAENKEQSVHRTSIILSNISRNSSTPQADRPKEQLTVEKPTQQRLNLSDGQILEIERAQFQSMLDYIEKLEENEKIPADHSKIIANFAQFNIRCHYERSKRLIILNKLLQLSQKHAFLVVVTIYNTLSLLEAKQVAQIVERIYPKCSPESKLAYREQLTKLIQPSYGALFSKLRLDF